MCTPSTRTHWTPLPSAARLHHRRLRDVLASLALPLALAACNAAAPMSSPRSAVVRSVDDLREQALAQQDESVAQDLASISVADYYLTMAMSSALVTDDVQLGTARLASGRIWELYEDQADEVALLDARYASAAEMFMDLGVDLEAPLSDAEFDAALADTVAHYEGSAGGAGLLGTGEDCDDFKRTENSCAKLAAVGFRNAKSTCKTFLQSGDQTVEEYGPDGTYRRSSNPTDFCNDMLKSGAPETGTIDRAYAGNGGQCAEAYNKPGLTCKANSGNGNAWVEINREAYIKGAFDSSYREATADGAPYAASANCGAERLFNKVKQCVGAGVPVESTWAPWWNGR